MPAAHRSVSGGPGESGDVLDGGVPGLQARREEVLVLAAASELDSCVRVS